MRGAAPTRAATRPRILAIVDTPGWAHDSKTRNLARVLEPEYEIVERFQNELTRSDFEESDLTLVYYWHQFERTNVPARELERYRGRMLCGICGHHEIDGPLRQPGIEAIERHAHAVFVNNRFLQVEFGPLLEVPVFYTPNGVDTALYRPGGPRPRSAKLRVGWAGSLDNQGRGVRNYDELIVPSVARTEGAELATAAREERWRGPEEMLEFYRSLDVYVCASRFEGTPNPCLEAAACGVPLVTTRVGNMPQLVQDGVNGFLVDWSIDAIAGRLELLKQDPVLRIEMGRAARRSVVAWDWRIQAANFRRMFDGLLDADGHGLETEAARG